VARLILDTTVLVTAERGRSGLAEVVDDADDVAIAAITAAELLVGVELADERRRPRRLVFVDSILAQIRIEPNDIETARVHAGLLAHTRRSGRSRGAHGLLIAATAVATARTVVTADTPGFSDLPGVALQALL
jgi:tRNA(fMet)-specific endonuclease VapC